MNLPKSWKATLGVGSFFAILKPIQEVWGIYYLVNPMEGHMYKDFTIFQIQCIEFWRRSKYPSFIPNEWFLAQKHQISNQTYFENFLQ